MKKSDFIKHFASQDDSLTFQSVGSGSCRKRLQRWDEEKGERKERKRERRASLGLSPAANYLRPPRRTRCRFTPTLSPLVFLRRSVSSMWIMSHLPRHNISLRPRRRLGRKRPAWRRCAAKHSRHFFFFFYLEVNIHHPNLSLILFNLCNLSHNLISFSANIKSIII